MSPPWATTSSRFCVLCAAARAVGSAAAAPATPAAFNSSRRVRPLMRHLPEECCYLRALGSGCQARVDATNRRRSDATGRVARAGCSPGDVNAVELLDTAPADRIVEPVCLYHAPSSTL